MAKVKEAPKPTKADTKNDEAANAEASVAPVKETKTVDSPLDITKLSAAQIAALQKQLSERTKQSATQRTERAQIMKDMLGEKDDKGEFMHTTRDIARVLAKQGLCAILTAENFASDDMKEEVEKEIRKVQAKKQSLEKATNEKGNLVHAAGSFGYKTSAGGAGSALSATKVKPDTIVAFFTAERVGELTAEQVASIQKALKAVK